MFQRDIHFDENFKHSPKPSLSIDFHVGVDHVDSLGFEYQEDDETPPPENVNQPKEHPPTAIEHPAQEHID